MSQPLKRISLREKVRDNSIIRRLPLPTSTLMVRVTISDLTHSERRFFFLSAVLIEPHSFGSLSYPLAARLRVLLTL